MTFFNNLLMFLSLILAVSGRPEPPSPYQYPFPDITENSFTKTPSANFQNYAAPVNSYGTPLSKSSIPTSSSSKQELVHKHIYVHVAPPDPDETFQRVQQPPPVSRKHYKIIFVKVPSYEAPPVVARQEEEHHEKTLIYVLVKKPEEPQVQQQQVIQRMPDRPEVYFIKYKGKRGENLGVVEDNQSIAVEALGRNQGYRYDKPLK
ncbi:hypothetical protein ABEB36_000652 [Hypothenemus hampei]|uniref:DUF243 domain-containing protein n=1 Tax=Hypothenemus hampei TaxID=57062 RepID=A0ABD1FBY7_HYPHA